MWVRTYTKIYQNASAKDIWDRWADIDNWHEWNPGVEYCKLQGRFEKGSFFALKPKGAPLAQIELIEVEKGKKFTDCTTFPGAKMYGTHEIEETPDGLKLITTMKVEGWLKWVWVFLVARKIVAKTAVQTDNLVQLTRKKK